MMVCRRQHEFGVRDPLVERDTAICRRRTSGAADVRAWDDMSGPRLRVVGTTSEEPHSSGWPEVSAPPRGVPRVCVGVCGREPASP